MKKNTIVKFITVGIGALTVGGLGALYNRMREEKDDDWGEVEYIDDMGVIDIEEKEEKEEEA